jgi:hypothetical protein
VKDQHEKKLLMDRLREAGKLEPGLELDELIAINVFGWYQESGLGREAYWHKKDVGRGNPIHLKYFSTDIRAAWELVEKFNLWVIPWHENNWTAVKENDIFVEIGNQNQAPTAPHAICLAALNIALNINRDFE